MKLDKDQSIIDLIDALHVEEKGWSLRDFWEADLCAIGFTSASQPDHLVYVSTFNMSPGRYYCECELHSRGTEDSYEIADSAEDIDLAALETKMLNYLGTFSPAVANGCQKATSLEV